MSQAAASLFSQTSPLPADFLNAYELLNVPSLQWSVAIYRLDRVDQRPLTHEERGSIKNAIWELRGKYKDQCRGYGFVIDIGKQMVAVPQDWKIPSEITHDNFHVVRERSFE